MATTTPFSFGQPLVLPFSASLGGFVWDSPQGLVFKPLTFNLSKTIGDLFNKVKDWMVRNLVPFFVGILVIIVGVIVITKIVDIF